ncbi:hypothetical protein [Belnapia rosea]|uniref:hypothetical protein n=1 Tax=Belnapia rosea TaxID=938405 RepID=UPI00088E0562|nr:hypothetical protein [Belnapia rosea]SDB08111.1 hypothetical protein SAMN02927895_00138 [Belnapia rosea]
MIRSFLAGALLLALPVAAQEVKAPETALQRIAALPAEAAGWHRVDVTDFEARPSGAGLGAAAEYRPVAGGPGVATLYVYDRGLAGGATPASLDGEFTQALREIEMLGAMRRYRVEARLPGPPVLGAAGREALRCAQFALAFDGGNRADSFLCLGVQEQRFVKLRMTLQAGAPEAEAQQLQALGGALLSGMR